MANVNFEIPDASEIASAGFVKSWSASGGKFKRDGEERTGFCGVITGIFVTPLTYRDGSPVVSGVGDRKGQQSVLVEVDLATNKGPETISWDAYTKGQNLSFAKALELVQPTDCLLITSAEQKEPKAGQRASTYVNLAVVNLADKSSKPVMNQDRRFEGPDEWIAVYKAHPLYKVRGRERPSDAADASPKTVNRMLLEDELKDKWSLRSVEDIATEFAKWASKALKLSEAVAYGDLTDDQFLAIRKGLEKTGFKVPAALAAVVKDPFEEF